MSDFKNNVKSLLFSKVTGNHGNRVGRESIDEAIHATHGGGKVQQSGRNASRHWLQIELLRSIVLLRRPSQPSGKIAGASASDWRHLDSSHRSSGADCIVLLPQFNTISDIPLCYDQSFFRSGIAAFRFVCITPYPVVNRSHVVNRPHSIGCRKNCSEALFL